MPQLYLASDTAYQFIKNLNYGFYMEISEEGQVAILIKLEPGLTNSIYHGCEIRLFIRNPNLFSRSCTLYVYDKKNDPFCVVARYLGHEDTVLRGFDKVVTAIADGRMEAIIVLYNEVNSPIFSSNIGVEVDPQKFENWLYKVYNEPIYRNFETSDVFKRNFYKETDFTSFCVQLTNEDHSHKETLVIHSPDYDGNEITSPVSGDGAFRHSDFIGDGKHGRLQELALATKLTTLFTEGESLFTSPRYDNGLELIDFILLNKNAAILIESKYVISEKSNKRNDSVIKATNQLNAAEQIILDQSFKMSNKVLDKRLREVDVVVKICILNDRVHLDKSYAKQLSSRFQKEDLPLFLSVTVFSDLLVGLYLKNPECFSSNLFSNLITVCRNFLESDELINYHLGFSIAGMNAYELNQLGKKPR